ncbi:MAG: hypothetical protein ACRDBY_14015 [Cetobacterium sp.]
MISGMEKMTVFYNKNKGNIKAIASGEQTLQMFYHQEYEEYEVFVGTLILDMDTYVLMNMDEFLVQNGEIRRKQGVKSYKVAE